MDSFGAELQGFEGLLKELRQLPAVLQQRAVKGALGTGANIFKREAMARAPVDTGTLQLAIYAARMVDQCTPTDEVWLVSAKSGKRFRHTGRVSSAAGPTQGIDRDAYYAKWVEYGHYARVGKDMGKTAKSAGRVLGVATWVPAKPYMRPAFEAKKTEVVAAMQAYITERLPQVAGSFNYLKAA